MTTDIPKGYGLISGHSQENAQAALAAAEEAGVDVTEVRTVSDGYIVPEKVLKAYEANAKAAEEDKKKTAKEPEPSTKTAAKAESRKKE